MSQRLALTPRASNSNQATTSTLKVTRPAAFRRRPTVQSTAKITGGMVMASSKEYSRRAIGCQQQNKCQKQGGEEGFCLLPFRVKEMSLNQHQGQHAFQGRK